jgi:hypothetical protein
MLIGGIVMAIGAVMFFVIAASVSALRVTFLITGVIFVGCSALMIRLGWGSDDRAKDEVDIREDGVPARATITAIEPTGTVRHKNPEMKMQLRLEIPGQPPYLVNKTDIVPAAQADQLIVGKAISVHSAKNDPLKIAIDWDDLNNVAPW